MLYDIAVHLELDVDTAVHVPSSFVSALDFLGCDIGSNNPILLCFHHSTITMSGNNNQRGRAAIS